MLGTIQQSLGTSLGLNTIQLSWLALAQGIGLAATSVFAGAFMDRSGKKIGVVLGLCAAIAGLALLSHPINLAVSIAAMAILGVGGSLVIVGANAIVNDVSDARRASALNILNLFVGLGGMATPFVAGNLLHSDATRVAWFAMGIAALALVLTLATPLKHKPPAAQAGAGGQVFGVGLLYVLSAITFLYTACEFAMWNWLPRYLIASDVPSATALNILSLGFACGMLLGRLGAAQLLAKASPLPVILASSVAMAVTTFLMLHLSSPVAIAVVVFLAGLAMAPVFPTTIAIVGRIFKQRSGTAIGFAITCGFSGLVLSSPVIAWLSGADPRGIGRGLLLIPVLSLVIVVTLVVFRRSLSENGKGQEA